MSFIIVDIDSNPDTAELRSIEAMPTFEVRASTTKSQPVNPNYDPGVSKWCLLRGHSRCRAREARRSGAAPRRCRHFVEMLWAWLYSGRAGEDRAWALATPVRRRMPRRRGPRVALEHPCVSTISIERYFLVGARWLRKTGSSKAVRPGAFPPPPRRLSRIWVSRTECLPQQPLIH